MSYIEMGLMIGVFICLSIIFGKYIYKIIFFKESKVDRFFNKLEKPIYKFLGIKSEKNMTWKTYGLCIIISNILMMMIGFIVLKLQGLLFFNPNNIGAMTNDLSINTVISFITNTNLQDYAGESGLSNLSQMIVITFLMFTSAATGFAVAGSFMRCITGHKKAVGNFFEDMVRIVLRLLVPVCVVISVILISQGVPQTLEGTKVVTSIENKEQAIALGPVASLESIKHLGTNGGGFFGANSSHPFENPTPLTNTIEMLAMMTIPGAMIYAFGMATKNKKQGWTIFISLLVLFIAGLAMCYHSESSFGISGNMEGKEVRFGIADSSLFTTVTTAFTTGSVNNMHDSLTPLGGMVAMGNMMLNTVFGGKGVGFMNAIMYSIIAVFICGLMVGRTPEFLSKKIEVKEIKLLSLVILIHPIIILIPSAIALSVNSGTMGITNGAYHGISQVVYQFASSAANNGSGFEGLLDNTVFWNLITGLVMLLGRYISMIILIAVASSMYNKKVVPESDGTLKTDNSTFSVILIATILIVGALTFLPVLALGPIAEHLTMGL